jgi:RNA polymerase sigma-70 factor (ECF subfamily)
MHRYRANLSSLAGPDRAKFAVFVTALRLVSSTSLLREAESNPDAFAAFYDAYGQQVLIFLARRLLDAETALDLMSETFAKALERRRQFRGSTAEEEQAWLFAIARSELSHFWRRGRVEREALQRINVEVPALAERDLERIEELAGVAAVAAGLRDALAGLPEEQRAAVELRVIEELGYEDLARRLEISQQTARARVSRGLRRLAEVLRSSGAPLEDAV